MIIISITGASGVCYGLNLIKNLLELNQKVAAVISDLGNRVLIHEMKFKENLTFVENFRKIYPETDLSNLEIFLNDDFFTPIASGSCLFESVVICPCSMKTLAAIANGYSDSLINRVADVALKEKRKLILVPRETPYSLIHIENMKKIMMAGGAIIPASPGFYTNPESLEDIKDFISAKVLDSMEISHSLIPRWNGQGGE